MNSLVLSSLSIGMLALLASQANAFDRYRGEEGISVTLTSDRADYYLGEPLRLRATVKNDSSRDLAGGFQLRFSATHPRSEVHLRWGDEAFACLDFLAPEDVERRRKLGTLAVPIVLKSGEEKSSEVTLAWNNAAKSPVLSQAGTLEVKVAMYAAPDKPTHVLWSNVLSVRVVPAPSSEQKAQEEFLQKSLSHTAQSAFALVRRGELERLEQAVAFLEQHPESIYAKHLRSRLISALETAPASKKAEQHRILQRLKGGTPQEP